MRRGAGRRRQQRLKVVRHDGDREERRKTIPVGLEIGSGKTRLALEVAAGVRRDFKDGVWLVELAPVADAAQVPRAAARVLGVGEDAKHSAAENLAAHLRACPTLYLLATSREALRFTGEHALPVLPLPVDDFELMGVSPEQVLEVASASNAVQLFVERAAAVNPGLTLSAETAPAVAGICRERRMRGQ